MMSSEDLTFIAFQDFVFKCLALHLHHGGREKNDGRLAYAHELLPAGIGVWEAFLVYEIPMG